MSTAIQAEPVPLRSDDAGVLRVGGTRVTLDTFIHAYSEGATAEEIVLRYDSLSLADVHSTISYYLRHRDELDSYLNERREFAATVRKSVEARQGVREIRSILMARQGKRA